MFMADIFFHPFRSAPRTERENCTSILNLHVLMTVWGLIRAYLFDPNRSIDFELISVFMASRFVRTFPRA